MSDHLLGSVLVAPLLTMLVIRALVDLLWPRTAVVACTVAAVLVAAASMISLAALAAPAAVELWALVVGTGPVTDAWRTAVTPRWLSWASLVAFCAQVGAVGATVRRQRLGLRSARAQAAALPGAAEVVVVPDDRVDAFALPGSPGRIVVTSGMMSALTAEQREIVIAHERAHLAARHHRFSFAARLAAAAHPGLRAVAPTLEYAVERWADEDAARVIRDRRVVARAISTAALLTTSPHAVCGTTTLHIGSFRRDPGRRRRVVGGRYGAPVSARRRRLPSGSGPVPRRVAALLVPPPGNRLNRIALSALPAALAAASCGLAIEALVDLPLPFAFTNRDC
ncbi:MULTISPECIES: M56 family metallopeptidase [unclassified Parafrankia]|uniref:M56 family metallopeptidase n=1 Tax=Parafrankia TaxID=2994362 RepID=UPI000DA52CE6|nr:MULTISPECIES: M56 family metallopeptidase [unclassified Parafrankia]TCJ40138.1 M56 family peptidase [Parafrankia sp. BMG5.11]CAI7976861.1 Peptidase M48 Ste24p [Frankia sp. Hr75.2]SQD97011.1 Peptidase M48 Ste24p [Parafrankia sp. Ea1.12]